jgi:hypothetical protein
VPTPEKILGGKNGVMTIPVIILAIYYPWLTPSPAFHVTFAYGASFKVFTIPVVISSEGNVLTDFHCFPGLLWWSDRIGIFYEYSSSINLIEIIYGT